MHLKSLNGFGLINSPSQPPYSSPHSLHTAVNLAFPLFLKHDKSLSSSVYSAPYPASPGQLLLIPQFCLSTTFSRRHSSLTTLISRLSPLLLNCIAPLLVLCSPSHSCDYMVYQVTPVVSHTKQSTTEAQELCCFVTVLPTPAQGLTEKALKYYQNRRLNQLEDS